MPNAPRSASVEHAKLLFEQALSMHQRGNLHEAERHYRTILNADPDHPDCRLALGLLRFQQGRNGEALEHISAALKLQPSNLAALMQSALVLASLGRLEKALAAYDKALAIKPDNVDALNNRGNILAMLKRADEALAAYDKALAIRPSFVDALSNRGNVLVELKRCDEALANYDAALAIKPDTVDTLVNRANILVELERLDEALQGYDRALAIRPDRVDVLKNRGMVLAKLERPDEGLAAYDKALAIKPDYVDALVDRGNLLVQLKRHDEALAGYDRALAIKPDFVDALKNRGVALAQLGRFDAVLASADKALAIRPDDVDALINRGNALVELERVDEALRHYDHALKIKPDNVDALRNRGIALANRGIALAKPDRLEEALVSYDRALALKPDDADTFYSRGATLIALGRFDKALGDFDEALAIRPDYADALHASAVTSLRLGDFSNGWARYEHRWGIAKDAPKRRLKTTYPVWKGQNVRGKRMIVFEEQGLGDVIQFSRYLKPLSTLGAQVTFLVRPEMQRVLRTLDQSVRFVDTEPVGETFDYECALMSLPLGFGTTLETIPTETPYLSAEPERVAKWRQRLGEDGFEIGIVWQGRKGGMDVRRSVALLEFEGISRLPGVRLIALQKGEGVEQLRDIPQGMAVETLGDDYDRDCAFLDAAAVMETLDLVITCDTSIAHLAGALGRPVWVVLNRVPDWRWMSDRTDSRWYRTMRLFRENTDGDWKGVFREIETALRGLLGDEVQRANALAKNASTPRVPVSWGELIDKITILEIKSVEIASEAARANVMKELILLQKVASSREGGEQLSNLKSSLKAVNAELWKIEDAIREKERKKEFDEEFVELARSVYRRNDERAAVKRTINTILASEIVEEKSYTDC